MLCQQSAHIDTSWTFRKCVAHTIYMHHSWWSACVDHLLYYVCSVTITTKKHTGYFYGLERERWWKVIVWFGCYLDKGKRGVVVRGSTEYCFLLYVFITEYILIFLSSMHFMAVTSIFSLSLIIDLVTEYCFLLWFSYIQSLLSVLNSVCPFLCVEEMIRGLSQIPWERVDVSFQKSTQRYIAHNTIQASFGWLH